MSDQSEAQKEHNDSTVDAMATVVFIGVIISMVVFWLSGQ